MGKKKISDRITIGAFLQIKIARTGKLSRREYSTIAKFQEVMPVMIEEVQKKTANTFLELLQEFHDRERQKKKAAKLPSNEKIVKGKTIKTWFNGGKNVRKKNEKKIL